MPESGLPIRVYEEDDMWHAGYGDGVIEDYDSQEEAESAATRSRRPKSATVVVEA